MMSSSNKILASIDNHKHNYWGHHLTLSRYPHHRIYLHFGKLFLTFAGNGDSFADPVSLGESWVMMWIKTEKIIFSNYDLKMAIIMTILSTWGTVPGGSKSCCLVPWGLVSDNWGTTGSPSDWPTSIDENLCGLNKKSCWGANSLHWFVGYSC